jgi:hypothetical protein
MMMIFGELGGSQQGFSAPGGEFFGAQLASLCIYKT